MRKEWKRPEVSDLSVSETKANCPANCPKLIAREKNPDADCCTCDIYSVCIEGKAFIAENNIVCSA